MGTRMNKKKIRVKKDGFNIIYADVPWHYNDKLDHDNMRGAAEDHYPVLKPKDLMALDISALAADDCILFLWTTGPQMDVAIDCIRSWGFKFKTMAFVWRKMNKKTTDTPFYGLGRWTRSNYEYVLLATRGKPSRVDKGIRQEVIHSVMSHSTKPDSVGISIKKLMGKDATMIELFARRESKNWHCTGLDLDGIDIRDLVDTYRIRRNKN